MRQPIHPIHEKKKSLRELEFPKIQGKNLLDYILWNQSEVSVQTSLLELNLYEIVDQNLLDGVYDKTSKCILKTCFHLLFDNWKIDFIF